MTDVVPRSAAAAPPPAGGRLSSLPANPGRRAFEELPISDYTGTARSSARRVSLTDRAYQHVRAQILQGALPVGAILAEASLADELGISKTPVRQALQLLRTEGLLEVGPRRQLVVRGFSAAHRNEILRIREALEEIAVETVCRETTLEQMDLLRLLLLRQKRAADAHDEQEFLSLDEEFHILIAKLANLPIVARLLEQMRGFARLMRLGRTQPPEHLQDILVEHTRIVDALERRDVAAALSALQEHLHHWDYLLAGDEGPQAGRA